MGIFEILCIILGIIVVLQFIVFLFINNKYSKTLRGLKSREVDDVTTKNGVRYTIDQTVVDEEGNANVSRSQKDIVLNPNDTQVVGIKNKVKPGKYTLLSTNGEEETFNIRIGNFVKEYSHNQDVVLGEGQEITAINTSVILR